MWNNLTWILLLILPCVLVGSRPTRVQPDDASTAAGPGVAPLYDYTREPLQEPPNEQVISVRITSSVAVGRGKTKISKTRDNKHDRVVHEPLLAEPAPPDPVVTNNDAIRSTTVADTPPELAGANIEFIKQLHSKKESRGLHNMEKVYSFPSAIGTEHYNESDDAIAEPSIKSILSIEHQNEESVENIENVPLARSIALSPSSKNYIQGPTHKPPRERGNRPRLTTVSFNVVHDTPTLSNNYNEHDAPYMSPSQSPPDAQKFYSEPEKFYNEPAKVYSQPAQVYSEPAKFYSEPAKIYSEPAKVYSEPAKIYSEPAKIYGEPAKFYSEPASLHLGPNAPPNYTPWQSSPVSSTISTTPVTTVTSSSIFPSTRIDHRVDQQPEKNYEVDENISVLTDGRRHGVQESTTESCKQDNCKVGYVVEGRQYRKYRVEERTSDGFIVGEYGVVRHEDGALRGVRYTADSDASPRLIYDALMKFLQLK